jgi:cell division protein FtsL
MVTIFITSFFSLAIASVFLLWLQNLKVKKLNQIIIDQDIVIDELEQEVDDWFGSYLRATVDKTKLK